MIIQNDDDRLVLICAFRYALGRMTYVPGVIAEEVKKQWLNLNSGDRELIKREVKEAIDHKAAGMDCDVRTWQQFLELRET